jgi:hypothetical protein
MSDKTQKSVVIKPERSSANVNVSNQPYRDSNQVSPMGYRYTPPYFQATEPSDRKTSTKSGSSKD